MEIKNIEELRESLKNCKVSIFDIDGTYLFLTLMELLLTVK